MHHHRRFPPDSPPRLAAFQMQRPLFPAEVELRRHQFPIAVVQPLGL